jgi:methylmalonyl-CoA/ethylmalonyl-CoA epimerase
MKPFKFHHLGVAVADLEEAILNYQNVFGYVKLSDPIDEPSQKVKICFMGTGDPSGLMIELIQPLADDSPASKMLAKGVSAYHTCYEVNDIIEALNSVRSKGCIVIQEPSPRATYDGRRVAWFYMQTRELVELVEEA